MDKGLVNFWGYQPLSYFAPDPRYLGEGGLGSLKAAIRELNAAGIETWLDVVYNHTAEGDHTGPTLAFRGIDNASYYKLDPADRRRTIDCTGCGNTFDVSHPRVMQLVLDSLRHWVTAYGIAGFRFDLASSLGRAPSPSPRRRPSSRRWRRIRSSPGSRWWPSPGISGRGAISSAAIRAAGASGTTSSATPRAASGRAIPEPSPRSRRG